MTPTHREQARELDARIAELLGYKPIWCNGKPSILFEDDDCPAYSTDGTAMLALLEAMRGRGYSAQIYFDARKVTPAEARFVNEDDDRKRGIAHAATLMEAVAVAALAALEGA